jgi:hypothetical protein
MNYVFWLIPGVLLVVLGIPAIVGFLGLYLAKECDRWVEEFPATEVGSLLREADCPPVELATEGVGSIDAEAQIPMQPSEARAL